MHVLTGISTITRAELSQTYLDKPSLEKVCDVLGVAPEVIIDDEYRFFYHGYKPAIDYLLTKLTQNEILARLGITDWTIIKKWRTGQAMPNFKNRRALVKLYNTLTNTQ